MFRLPAVFRTLLTSPFWFLGLGGGWLGAAPNDAGQAVTPPFTAQELAQGFSNQKILALPRARFQSANNPAEAEKLAELETAAGYEIERVFDRFSGLRVLRLPAGKNPQSALAELEATGRYEFVEVDSLRFSDASPSDPKVTDQTQWYLRNAGQAGGLSGADLNMEAAWDIRTDASTIIVAVIDSGARLTHQDIAPNLWRNPREIAGNNIDDDNNGWVDDVHGIDALNRTGDPTDPEHFGHGTHVAGIIGAAANNGVAGSGVAWRVQIMPLLFLGGLDRVGTISGEIECIDYAIAQGAHVINASFGTNQFSQAEAEAIARARDADIVFVTAAGNQSRDVSLNDRYPVGHLVDNIVGVANSNRLDEPYFETNFSSGFVDLAAPGTDILSLHSTSDTATRFDTGSSMSSPMVAGAVALLRAQYPSDGYRAIINRLLRGTRDLDAWRGRVQTGGRLDVAAALSTFDFRPFNDDFADRAILAGERVRARSSTTHATTEVGEPAHAGQLARSVWFTWTAPATSAVEIDTVGSPGDTHLAVYTGTSLSGLSPVATNDNAESGLLTSRVSFSAAAGETFQIAVDTTSPDLVALNLNAHADHDAFALAIGLDADRPAVSSSNANATRESGEPVHVSGSNGRTLWYTWTAPESGPAQVSAYSLSADPILAVYTGNTLSGLTRVGNSNNTGVGGGNLNAMVAFNATAGTTYRIALDSRGSVIGPINLAVSTAAWQFATGDTRDRDLRRPSLGDTVAVGADGALYFGSFDRSVYALNPNGTMRWRVAVTVDEDSHDPPIGPVALAYDDTLLFGTNAGVLYALNPDGSTRWTAAPEGSPALAAPAVAADGTVFFHDRSGTLRAYSPAGEFRWSYTRSGPARDGSPIISAQGTVVLPANDGALHGLNPDTGGRRWIYQPILADNTADPSGITASPSIDAAGNLYAATGNGTAFSVTANGTNRWVFRPPESPSHVVSALALGDGRAYFATFGGYLYALDQATGSLVWRAPLAGAARGSSPAIADDGSIFVADRAGTLQRFSPAGAHLREWTAGLGFHTSPVLAHGRAYIGNQDGKVYAFELGNTGPAHGPDSPWPQHRFGPRQVGRATIEALGWINEPVPTDPGRLVNLSVRNRTVRATGVLTAGFVLQGSVGKELVIRGVGPTLADFGVTGNVAATELKLYRADETTPLATNAGWTAATGDGRELGAFALPAGSSDSVVRETLGGGAYTAQILPATNTTDPGIALVEIYDGDTNALTSRLTNLSARTEVAANGDVTMGFVLDGQTPRTVLLRAVGPGLSEFGVDSVLADPRLMLINGAIAQFGNDDWSGVDSIRATAESVGAFPLMNDSADAALLTRLPPGIYTVRVTAPTGQSGVVLVEVYLVAE
jgi:outer membrane protein assembly factor BamB